MGEVSDTVAATNEIKTIIQVKILPRSSQNRIIGKVEGIFKVKLTAPPVDGKANKALIQFLAKRLGVARQDIEIISGERSRKKTLQVSGITLRDVERLLQ